ncbi:MAG: DUF1428 domain-containing protein [bacterium]
MKYVDGFVIVVPDANLKQYRELARKCGKIWREHGALEYFECVGDDLDVKKMKILSFTKLAKAKEGEAVVFSFVVYKSRKDRDRVNAAVMADKRMKKIMASPDSCPFDPMRMAMGGFKVMVEA